MSNDLAFITPLTAAAFAQALPHDADLWVFGYGSLMWDPGFPFVERRQALLRGYHRRFCIYSIRHRGTPECPGLVFGLDCGGSCSGMAFRVSAAAVPTVLEVLWAREMSTHVYRPRMLQLCLDEGALVMACAFVVDISHVQYCIGLDIEESAKLIRCAVGDSGSNIDYLINTVEHLELLGIFDHELGDLLDAVVRQSSYS